MKAVSVPTTLREIADRPDMLYQGVRTCSGCGASLIAKLVLKAIRRPVVVVSATGCLEVATSILPYTSWKVPWIHNAFENAAATASGIEAAYKAMAKKGLIKEVPDIVVLAGDGGTYDIGFQSLSGALERGHDFLYVLYDNEAYMNTGIQRSGGTPRHAWTTTSPAGRVLKGKPETKKPIALIAAEHRIPYVATASPSEPHDLMRKVRKGLEVDGPAFLHVICPCPRGWRFDPSLSIEVARLAVRTCFFPLWECYWEDGDMVLELTGSSKLIAEVPELKLPVEAYLAVQGRFAHLFKPERMEPLIRQIQADVDANWKLLLRRAGMA